jgi:archaemetzincin
VKAIYLIPIGTTDEEAVASIEMCLWHSFGFEIKRLPAVIDLSFAYEPQRGQYSSVLILRSLQTAFPPDALRLLGVTECDLFIPMLSFVFGQAQLNGGTALVSLARLHQVFYGLPENKTVLTARAVKEATHEIGHTFGLTHCLNPGCPMSLSNTVWQVDLKGEELCENCVLLLNENPHFKHLRRP